MELKARFRGCLLGLAVGDAVGTSVEFCQRGTFPPVSDMTGGGPFHLQPGEWTDDTSMALCLATSLAELGKFDAHDQMRRYLKWYEYGEFSCRNYCFDIGNTTRAALIRFKDSGEPFSGITDVHLSGNGSIMRLAPIPLFFYPDREQIAIFSAESSRTTHGSKECLDACRLLGIVIAGSLAGRDKDSILSVDHDLPISSVSIKHIAQGTYRDKSESSIRGTGYVVDSLEAALWSFWNSDSFESAVLKAANLGDDADTTAAVCGQIAGAFYGIDGIPDHWLNRLAKRDEIVSLADRLLSH